MLWRMIPIKHVFQLVKWKIGCCCLWTRRRWSQWKLWWKMIVEYVGRTSLLFVRTHSEIWFECVFHHSWIEWCKERERRCVELKKITAHNKDGVLDLYNSFVDCALTFNRPHLLQCLERRWLDSLYSPHFLKLQCSDHGVSSRHFAKSNCSPACESRCMCNPSLCMLVCAYHVYELTQISFLSNEQEKRKKTALSNLPGDPNSGVGGLNIGMETTAENESFKMTTGSLFLVRKQPCLLLAQLSSLRLA